MNWKIEQGDVLAVSAEVLVCSANVFLNLSGGVGGEILRRHGDAMQRHLHGWLAQQGKHFVQQGEVVVSPGFGTPFKYVLHAVAVDAFYQTSSEVIERVGDAAFRTAASLNARTLAMVALGTGFGRLPMGGFARGLLPLMKREYPPIESVTIRVAKDSDLLQIRNLLTEREQT